MILEPLVGITLKLRDGSFIKSEYGIKHEINDKVDSAILQGLISNLNVLVENNLKKQIDIERELMELADKKSNIPF